MYTGNHQQGIALVVVLLSAMTLLVTMLAITATLALSSQRTLTDGRATLQAQYAAESGLSLARSRQRDAEEVLSNLHVPTNVDAATIAAHAKNFCGADTLYDPGAVTSWTPEQRREGVLLCEAAPVDESDETRFSLFTTYIPQNVYPRDVAPRSYWREAFGSGGVLVDARIAVDAERGAETWYRASFGLVPEAVRLMGTDNYRFDFSLAPVTSTGEVRAGGEVVATRTVGLETPGRFEVSVAKPNLNSYVLLRNNTRAQTGAQLYFAGGERYDGPVHTNGAPGFARQGEEAPKFFSTFTTSARRVKHKGVTEGDYPDIFAGDTLDNSERFGADALSLPTSSTSQLRASFGDVEGHSGHGDVQGDELASAWGVASMERGVYYSRGDGAEANQTNRWLGGLYIRGDVSDLTFTTKQGQQVIQITHTPTATQEVVTTFQQERGGSWTVSEGGITETLSGDFSGVVYVDGAVESLGGDGTNAADLAPESQLILTATGDVTIRRSLTYAADPRQDEAALNVLGIYTDRGNVFVDGPRNRDLSVHAAVLVSGESKGLGLGSAGQRARFVLLGSLAEDQPQRTRTRGANAGGYEVHHIYDPRFADGFAPPFFPALTKWSSKVERFSREQGLWDVRSR